MPPKVAPLNQQLSLFSQFLSNDIASVSNTVEIWDSIPKYFFTAAQTAKLRTSDGLAEPFSLPFMYKGLECEVQVQPALIQQANGRFKAFFPSVTEELVEEALKKILTERPFGLHVPENSETWVKFSLQQLRRELSRHGRTRNIDEIKQAIQVMSKVIITLSAEGEQVWRGPVLADLITVGRGDYEESDSEQLHAARLPLFIAQAINRIEYRQFNYGRSMQCDHPLSRYIYKLLVHRFTQANSVNSYHFRYASLRDSGLLMQGIDRNSRRKVIVALNELVTIGVLTRYESVSKTGSAGKGRPQVVDVTYTVWPTAAFISEQKASNRRRGDSERTPIQEIPLGRTKSLWR